MDNNHKDFDKESIQDTKKLPDLEQNELYSKTPNIQQQNDTSLEDLKQSYQAPSQEPKRRRLTKGRIAVNTQRCFNCSRCRMLLCRRNAE